MDSLKDADAFSARVQAPVTSPRASEKASMKIYVGNLSFSTTEDTLRSLFEAHGDVASASLVMDRETGRPRGFGFVEMNNDEQAKAAMGALNGKNVDGRDLTVNEAKPREGSRRWRRTRWLRRRPERWRRRWWPRRLRRRSRGWWRRRPLVNHLPPEIPKPCKPDPASGFFVRAHHPPPNENGPRGGGPLVESICRPRSLSSRARTASGSTRSRRY
jgi:cold-inducible RNA-binding protein